MKRMSYICAIMFMAVLAGCRKDDVADALVLPECAREMVISVKSGMEDPKFTFLFWEKTDFDNGLKSVDGAPALPYFIAEPTGEIGSYEEIKGTTEAGEVKTDYNTGRVYPDSYGIAVCTGYGPYGSVYPASSGSDATVAATSDYCELYISNPGVTDVVVSHNYLEGSSLFPFNGNLEFFHPQIQLTVTAKLAETMAKYIHDISFSISSAYLLNSLVWDTEDSTYYPSETRGEISYTSAVLAEQLNKSDTKAIGTVYVIPSLTDHDDRTMDHLEITITGKISNTSSDTGSDFSMTVTADLTTLEAGSPTLNDSVELLLYFDEDQIELTAVKLPWQEGGNILVPIHPIPEPGSE